MTLGHYYYYFISNVIKVALEKTELRRQGASCRLYGQWQGARVVAVAAAAAAAAADDDDDDDVNILYLAMSWSSCW